MRWLSPTGARLSQPQGAARIDWSNPITRGLVAACWPGARLADPGVRHVSRFGQGVRGAVLAGPPVRVGVASSTVLVVDVYSAADNGNLWQSSDAVWADTASTWPNDLGLVVRSTQSYGRMGVVARDTGGTTRMAELDVLPGSLARDARIVRVATVAADLLVRAWGNGEYGGSSTGLQGYTYNPPAASSLGPRFGVQPTSPNDVATSQLLGFRWARVLSDWEVADISANPEQVFEQSPRIWVPVSAGGGPPALSGAACTQANTSSAGAISQRHVLTGAASAQGNQAAAGAIVQRHALSGAPCSQASASSSGAVAQRHTLAASPCSQANAGAAGAVLQRHTLAGANATQANSCSTGAIGSAGQLVAAPCSQANGSGTGAITQRHKLASAGGTQANASPSAAIVQRHTLAAASASQTNTCTAGAVATRHSLQAAPSVQDNVAAASAIVQRHVLQAASCSQANTCSSPYLILGELVLPPGCEITAVRPRSLEIEASSPRAIEIAARRPRRLEIGP